LWYFSSPRLIVFGEDALDHLEEVEGSRAFIVTDKTLVKLGVLERVAEKLRKAGMEVTHFDGVQPDPPDTVVQECAKAMKSFKPDIIVGLGGGSSIDTAKAAWVLYENPDLPIEDITPLTPIKLTRARLIAIPTTSGTGSDATWAAVVTDTKDNRKMELASREIVAHISILDPSLPRTMPPKVTAATGMDALSQGIDAYTVQWRNDFSDALAIHSVKLILKYLARAVKNPDDMEAREKMHNAATMSGLAFSNSQVGITHSFGHAMGAVYHMTHGVAVGMVLPYSIEYSVKTCADLYGSLAREVDVAEPEDDDMKASMLLRDRVVALIREIGMPLSLKEYGISREKFEETFEELVRQTEESACNINNCREPTNEDIRRFWHYLYEGKSIDF